MALFLLSDVATFAAGFVYYAFVRVGPWPPSDLPPLLGSLVLVNTAVLVVSSGTIHLAHGALDSGRRERFVAWLAVTVGLGVVFVGGQALEYYEFVVEEGFSLSSGAFGSAFYGLTGLHGLHVTLGVVLLASLLVRALRGHYAEGRDTAVRTVSLYWHFVDAVWLFLVVVLYVGAVVG
jgi:cytochrome c oxidase subunit 3